MLNLFRTGKVFFFLAGLSFLLAALKYALSDEYATFSGSLLATGCIWLVVGLALRQKYTKETQGG
jgi:hypothetical protein